MRQKNSGAGTAGENTSYSLRQGRLPDSNQRSSKQKPTATNLATQDIVIGVNPVYEALHSGMQPAKLFVDKNAASGSNSRIAKILKLSKIHPTFTPRKTLDSLTDLPHQGVVLVCKPYKLIPAEDLLGKHWAHPPIFVACDQITDSRNLGAIIRSAAAFRASAVLIGKRRSAGITAGTWKASAGAVHKIPIAEVGNLTSYILRFKQRRGFVIALAADAPTLLSKSIFLRQPDRPLLLIVGSENRGISRLVKQHCDELLSIPIADEIDSLNAAVAISIALYEMRRGGS